MTGKRRRDIIIYVLLDILTAAIAWSIFYVLKEKAVDDLALNPFWSETSFWYGNLLLPAGWLVLYAIYDTYRDLYRLSRLSVLVKTFWESILGVTVLFVVLYLWLRFRIHRLLAILFYLFEPTFWSHLPGSYDIIDLGKPEIEGR